MKKLFSPLFIFVFLFLFVTFTFLSKSGIGGSFLPSIARTHPLEIIVGKSVVSGGGRYDAYGFPCVAFEVKREYSGRAHILGQPIEPETWSAKIDVPKLGVNLIFIFLFTWLLVKVVTFGYRE